MIRALRTLRNEPGFALSSVFTLALGIACSSAMFSLFYAVLLAPVPYADPLRVVAIHGPPDNPARWRGLERSGGVERHLRDSGALPRRRSRRAIAQPRRMGLGLLGVPHLFPGVRRGAGARPQLYGSGPERAAVVSGGFARRVFGDAAAAIGEVVRIDIRAYEVVAVMPSRLLR
jgi:hypothetical protein